MEAKEKAKELYLKMLDWVDNGNEYLERNIVSTAAKQCALIAVDEMIKQEISLLGLGENYIPTWYNWVKKEIINL
jgi:hypothetical protein